MNRLETLSLVTTQATLIGLTYFLPSLNVNYGYRLILTVLLALLNFGVMAYFLYHLLRIARDWVAGVNLDEFKTFCQVRLPVNCRLGT